MGMNPKVNSVGGPPGGGKAGTGVPGPSAPETIPAALSALLASEDLLFRDPFAEFTPSSR
jgi:hypothetical protein